MAAQLGGQAAHGRAVAPPHRGAHDGKAELIVGIEGSEHVLAVWAYTLRGGVVNRILDTAGTPL
ncbi:hypothetical protein ACFWJ3_36740, partial [Streptomyces ardesiacus]